MSDLVQAHLKETQATVMAAVMRGFGAPNSQIKLPPSREMKARSFRGRRSTADVSKLAERLYELICARFGELRVSFSAELGKTARELYGPIYLASPANTQHAARIVPCYDTTRLERYARIL